MTTRTCVCLLIIGLLTACAREEDTAPPVATPTVTLDRQEAVIGSPIAMKYRFAVAPDAPALRDDYWVFVHFLDSGGELMWTDDHAPPTPTRQWKPGSIIEYDRMMFVPKFPYVGEAVVEVGLYSPTSGERLAMSGETAGQRSYKVGAFDLRPQTDSVFVVFKDGWHQVETVADSLVEWQWSKKDATIAFRNPRRGAQFYLQLDQPVKTLPPQNVVLRIGDKVIDSFTLRPEHTELRRVALSPEQLGTGETTEVRLSVDRTFVPAALPELKSHDPRELGVRVFRAFLQPG
jgi:hypothetical protein